MSSRAIRVMRAYSSAVAVQKYQRRINEGLETNRGVFVDLASSGCLRVHLTTPWRIGLAERALIVDRWLRRLARRPACSVHNIYYTTQPLPCTYHLPSTHHTHLNPSCRHPSHPPPAHTPPPHPPSPSVSAASPPPRPPRLPRDSSHACPFLF